MPTQPSPSVLFDPAQLARLACPVCLGALVHQPPRLVCAACSRAYPILDGIPVLIPNRAEAPQNS
jgi:uncharacterized protein YbaR (Trm112 family)